jgi:hypothetical protein
MRYLPCLFFLIVWESYAAQATAELRPDASTRDDFAISAATDLGDIQLPARELQVQIAFPGGKDASGHLLIFFDPVSGYTLRQFWYPSDGNAVPLKDALEACCKTYLAPDRLVLFNSVSGGIYIRECKAKATSMDDAESKALRDSVGDLDGYVAKMTGGPKLSWIQALGEEFATEPGNSIVGPVKLLGVSRKDGN